MSKTGLAKLFLMMTVVASGFSGSPASAQEASHSQWVWTGKVTVHETLTQIQKNGWNKSLNISQDQLRLREHLERLDVWHEGRMVESAAMLSHEGTRVSKIAHEWGASESRTWECLGSGETTAVGGAGQINRKLASHPLRSNIGISGALSCYAVWINIFKPTDRFPITCMSGPGDVRFHHPARFGRCSPPQSGESWGGDKTVRPLEDNGTRMRGAYTNEKDGQIITTSWDLRRERDPSAAGSSAGGRGPVEQADIVVAAGAERASGRVETPVKLSFVVSNRGPRTATDTVAIVPIPPGTVVRQIQSSIGECTLGAQPTCALGTLAPDASVTLSAELAMSRRGLHHVMASAYSNATLDSDLSNNVAKVAVQVTD